MNSLKVMKLVTGETIVARVVKIDISKDVVALHNPLQPLIQKKKRDENSESEDDLGIQFALVPIDTIMFLAMEGQQQIIVNRNHIVWEINAKHFHKVEEVYKKMTGEN